MSLLRLYGLCLRRAKPLEEPSEGGPEDPQDLKCLELTKNYSDLHAFKSAQGAQVQSIRIPGQSQLYCIPLAAHPSCSTCQLWSTGEAIESWRDHSETHAAFGLEISVLKGSKTLLDSYWGNMSVDGACLTSDRTKVQPGNEGRSLSRSPHPYDRAHIDIVQDADRSKNVPPVKIEPTGDSVSRAKLSVQGGYFDADSRKRRKQLDSSSESGTEADDEKGAFLSSLPAPPVRPRKGLKEGYGSVSPLLTPSYIDEATQKSSLDEELLYRETQPGGATKIDEAVKIRDKFLRRRRAELARRLTETVLLGFLSFPVISKGTSVHSIFSTGVTDIHQWDARRGSWTVHVFLFYALTLAGLYALYPIRIIFQNYSISLRNKKPWYYIHIPAAFDPATLLYPTIVPVLVAILMLPSLPEALPLNTILGLSSIPSRIIPMNRDVPYYNSPQWALSLAPLFLLHDPLDTAVSDHAPRIFTGTKEMKQEDLVYLYLLHQSVMPVLQYLTTTSLLSAELQLLSASLINILLLASSSQAVILKALLWIGGLSVLIFCGKALQWEVALARIPSWRFRRPKTIYKNSYAPVVVQAVNDSFGGRLGPWKFSTTEDDSSDNSESSRPIKSLLTKKRTLPRTGLKPQISFLDPSGLGNVPSAPIPAAGDSQNADFKHHNKNTDQSLLSRKHQRRSTLPSDLGASSRNLVQKSLQTVNIAKAKASQSFSFRSLTMAQAVVLKWGFALYVYGIVFVLIAIPIRLYISTFALRGQEPVGWALGYLFGDINVFRTLVTQLGLESWTGLPSFGLNYDAPIDYDFTGDVTERLGVRNARLMICLYCMGIILAGLTVVLRLCVGVEVDTRRKVFHGMMVAMFLPTIFIDPTFISLALILVLAVFLLLDLFRASQLPPVSRPLTNFLAPYVDGRDHRGPVIVSHIFLLIGCAIPLWLSLAAIDRQGPSAWHDWSIPTRDLSMISGVVCVGMGDAAASLVGRRFGRHRWPWTGGKSLEGSLAFAMAVLTGLVIARLWLLTGGWQGDTGDAWGNTIGKGMMAACGASLTEAVLTGGNDNVIVPVVLWLLVKGLNI